MGFGNGLKKHNYESGHQWFKESGPLRLIPAFVFLDREPSRGSFHKWSAINQTRFPIANGTISEAGLAGGDASGQALGIWGLGALGPWAFGILGLCGLGALGPLE